MHTQFWSKMVDGKSVIKYFGCCSFKQARGAKHIAPVSKKISGLRISIAIGFIIKFLLSKKKIRLTEL
jgi:hypothetical protein